MSKQLTAVEWLMNHIQDQIETGETDLRTTLHFCRKSLDMEKEQIMEAFNNGYSEAEEENGVNPNIKPIAACYNALDYYNQTYGA
jgi:hypothetical protein